MTTTIKIKRKSNIRERRNCPRKVKLNYSKANDSTKANKTSNTIVNVIKDTSQNIIDKAKANLFGTLENSVITKNQLEINNKTSFQSSDNSNSSLTDTIPQKKELNQNKITQTLPNSTKNKYIEFNNQYETVEDTNNDDNSSQNSLQNGQQTPPITNYNKNLSENIIQNKLKDALKVLSPSEKMAKLRERAKINDKNKQKPNKHTQNKK